MNKNTNIRNIEEIDKIMTERRNKFNNATRKITEGSNLFGNQEPPKSMEEEENEFMNNFNENYYLENNKKNNILIKKKINYHYYTFITQSYI